MVNKTMLPLFIITISLLVISPCFSAMDGLIGAWLFDSDSGKTAKDASGKGHDGEYMGNAKVDKGGKFGSCLSCDGTEAYVAVPDSGDFEFDGDFTIACWFQNTVAPADNSGLVTKGYDKTAAAGGDAKPWYLVYFLRAGTIDMFLRDTSAVNSRAVGKTPVNDGSWHHVIGMRAGNKVKVYIDGKEDGVADAVNAKYGENTQPLVFMVHYSRWITGLMDEVAVFNKALSDTEIATVVKGLGQIVNAVDAKEKLTVTWGEMKSQ